MKYNLDKELKLFMIFDILGDTERTGPLLWKIDRVRLEDIKDHSFDLLLMYRILRKYFPQYIDDSKAFDYIMCHDLPEAITGDITKFEGVSKEEIDRVTNIAINYIDSLINGVIDFSAILDNYEKRVDIESKIVNMLDKVHSSTTFIKYQSEKDIDMDDSGILPILRNHPFVAEKIQEGKDLADIFYEFHLQAITISDEECQRYNISREDADNIINVIRSFVGEMYNQKVNKNLFEFKKTFPKEAMVYNRNLKNKYIYIV